LKNKQPRPLAAGLFINNIRYRRRFEGQKAWFAEAEKRYEAYKEGRVLESKPAEEVFEEAFKNLKCRM